MLKTDAGEMGTRHPLRANQGLKSQIAPTPPMFLDQTMGVVEVFLDAPC